jgi:hypothetical protein
VINRRPAIVLLALMMLVAAAAGAAWTKQNEGDLASLTKRVTNTKGMGIFAKLSLKGDAEKLWRDLGDFHKGKSSSDLEQLRERYDLMVHKLEVSLKKGDADLAADVAAFREKLWERIKDPEAFSDS